MPKLKPTLTTLLLLTASARAATPDADWQTLQKILAPIQGRALQPIEKVVTPKFTPGMLLGNGDIGVVVGSDNSTLRFFFGKSDFWGTHWNPGHNAFENSILSLGGLTISSPQKSATTQPTPAFYKMEQDILNAEVRTTFEINGAPVSTRSFTADSDNLFITELSIPKNAQPQNLQIKLWMPEPNTHTTYPAKKGIDQASETLPATRTNNLHAPNEFQARAALALHILGTASDDLTTSSITPNTATININLQPGYPIQLVTAFRSDARIGPNGPTPDALRDDALKTAKAITPAWIAQLLEEHRTWWKNYWLQSFIQIDDQLLNEYYYGSLYIMGSATRAKTPENAHESHPFPPSLWANWLTSDDAAWGGRYFLNYNAEAPFYGTFSANRPDLVLPYADVIFAEFPWQKIKTANNGYQGVCFQRSLAPFHYLAAPPTIPPVAPEKNYKTLQDQKSDGAFALLPAIWYWEYTRDDDYLKTKLYPALKELDAFHRDYVTWDSAKNRWVVAHTAAHEEPQPWDTNTNLDLGFYRKITQTCLDASEALHTDENLRPAWKEFLAHLSDYPMGTEQNKPVFLMAEARGRENARLFSPGDQPINLEGTVFPGEQLAIGGDENLLQAARNSLDLMNSWGVTRGGNSNNGFCKEFPIAARIAWPPEDLLAKFKAAIQYQWRPTNLTVFQGGGGIETAGSIECINSMLLQSGFANDHTIRIFPNWPKSINAKFTRLRAKGAFLITAEQKDGQILNVEITSEKGGPLQLANPWPAAPHIASNESAIHFTLNGKLLTLATQAGATYTLTP